MFHHLSFSGDLATTAMGIMPHEDPEEALRLAFTMDIPFWPQLPRVSFREDMYVQALEGFPGLVMDEAAGRLYVDGDAFIDAIPEYLEKEDDPEFLALSDPYSLVYRKFLETDLSSYRSIRGQIISPVSLALKITDQKGMPIVYNDEMRGVAFSFIRNKANVQYRELAGKNPHAFVWIDDPGLEFIFSAMCGYDNLKARRELTEFFDAIEGPRGLHLCGRPDWDFLLALNIEVLSFNAYAFGDVFVTYDRVIDFMKRGGIISWGIVPTWHEELCLESVDSLAERLRKMWLLLEEKGLDRATIEGQSILAPATCNLLNADKSTTVENAFKLLTELSRRLKEK
ncbi:MAG TPA: hypothetical protein VGJ94_11830 [Syntrophorhabdaceae bacterium]|jgi:hypothetical protein